MNDNPFNFFARRYDQWFESPKGRRIFEIETACLGELIGEAKGRWLEVGVGTGRFAEALCVREGVDLSRAALEIAARRGIRARVAAGEGLPYPDNCFDGVLMVTVICFFVDPAKVLKESRRVLRADGRLIIGLVPGDSPWGQAHAQKGREGHRFYSVARFRTCDEALRLAADAGFTFDKARSCLFSPPGVPADSSQREGIVAKAGFVACRFSKTAQCDKENPRRIVVDSAVA
ncbi:MAG: class I SAM-dependent methyltransferase [Planctomycetes bacterium]|nr:class I SAM-dependent methyltransferase [Planctomycetota bacterium]